METGLDAGLGINLFQPSRNNRVGEQQFKEMMLVHFAVIEEN